MGYRNQQKKQQTSTSPKPIPLLPLIHNKIGYLVSQRHDRQHRIKPSLSHMKTIIGDEEIVHIVNSSMEIRN